MIPFGAYAPDRARFNPEFLQEVVNAEPKAQSWGPFRKLVPFTDALPGVCRGYFLGRRSDGSYTAYAGTTTGLYRYNNATNGWDDISGPDAPFTLAAPDNWAFEQFDQYVVATNGADDPQYIDIDIGPNFAKLTGAPKAKYVRTFGNVLFLGHLTGNPSAVTWSDINNIFVWNEYNTFSDTQVFTDGGFVQGMMGGQSGGYIFQRNAIQRVNFAPDTPYGYVFNEVDYGAATDARGCVAPWSIVAINNDIYWLDENGFYAIRGGQIVPIGAETYDATFLEDVRDIEQVQGTIDPASKNAFFRFASNNHAPVLTTDKVACFNWELQRWWTIEEVLEWIQSAVTPGETLEGLDSVSSSIDALPYSLDSSFWKGGRPVLIGFDAANKLGYFGGDNYEARFRPGDQQFVPEGRSFVEGYRPFTDTDAAMIRSGTRESPGKPIKWRLEQPTSSVKGVNWARAEGRLHIPEVRIPEATTWTDIAGLEPIGVRAVGT